MHFHRSHLRPVTSARETMLSCPWKNIELPADVLAVPTMLSVRERQLLNWLSRNYVSGIGRIVDGGSFLGGSTAALASGLADRDDGPWKNTIASYDLFRVEEYTLTYFANYFPDQTIGSSFRSAFDANVTKWSQHIEVREGDAREWGWSGEPIEVLFLDFVKTWSLNDLVLEQFLPALIPGHSVIIQQDYLWGHLPWIHITMELLESCVTILDSMPNGTVAYLLTSPIPTGVIGARLRETLPASDQRHLMDRAVDRWRGEEKGLVELARVMLIGELNGPAAARSEFADVLERYTGVSRVEQCAAIVGQYIPGEMY